MCRTALSLARLVSAHTSYCSLECRNCNLGNEYSDLSVRILKHSRQKLELTIASCSNHGSCFSDITASLDGC